MFYVRYAESNYLVYYNDVITMQHMSRSLFLGNNLWLQVHTVHLSWILWRLCYQEFSCTSKPVYACCTAGGKAAATQKNQDSGAFSPIKALKQCSKQSFNWIMQKVVRFSPIYIPISGSQDNASCPVHAFKMIVSDYFYISC